MIQQHIGQTNGVGLEVKLPVLQSRTTPKERHRIISLWETGEYRNPTALAQAVRRSPPTVKRIIRDGNPTYKKLVSTEPVAPEEDESKTLADKFVDALFQRYDWFKDAIAEKDITIAEMQKRLDAKDRLIKGINHDRDEIGKMNTSLEYRMKNFMKE